MKNNIILSPIFLVKKSFNLERCKKTYAIKQESNFAYGFCKFLILASSNLIYSENEMFVFVVFSLL